MAAQLVSDVTEIEAEEGELVQVEMDPLLLMTDTQIKAEIDKLSPEEKSHFDDFASFAEDWYSETGKYEPMDQVMKELIRKRYPGIPSRIISQVVQPEELSEEGAVEVPPVSESSSDKALVTAIFPSTDPAVLSYNLKGKAAERTDEDYESVGSQSDEEELDSTQIAQIWRDMAKLKRDEAALYDKLAKAAPTMTQGDLLYSVERTPRPTSQLPQCVEDMYTRIDNPHRFRVALAAAERLINVYKQNREAIKPEPLQDTAHRFEVTKKDVYELLRGEKYMKVKAEVKSEESAGPPKAKKAKTETIAKSARRIVTTLVAPPSAEDLATAGSSTQ